MTDFKPGDEIYIATRRSSEWNGFRGRVGEQSNGPYLQVYPNGPRPDGHQRRPFYWESTGLRLSSRSTTPEEPSEAVSGDSEDSQSGSKGPGLAHGERLREYGPPHVSFQRIAEFWTIYLEGVAREQGYDPNQVPDIQPEDVAAMMILLKVSRKITDGKADTLDDIDGYTETIRMLRSTNQED